MNLWFIEEWWKDIDWRIGNLSRTILYHKRIRKIFVISEQLYVIKLMDVDISVVI